MSVELGSFGKSVVQTCGQLRQHGREHRCPILLHLIAGSRAPGIMVPEAVDALGVSAALASHANRSGLQLERLQRAYQCVAARWSNCISCMQCFPCMKNKMSNRRAGW